MKPIEIIRQIKPVGEPVSRNKFLFKPTESNQFMSMLSQQKEALLKQSYCKQTSP